MGLVFSALELSVTSCFFLVLISFCSTVFTMGIIMAVVDVLESYMESSVV